MPLVLATRSLILYILNTHKNEPVAVDKHTNTVIYCYNYDNDIIFICFTYKMYVKLFDKISLSLQTTFSELKDAYVIIRDIFINISYYCIFVPTCSETGRIRFKVGFFEIAVVGLR